MRSFRSMTVNRLLLLIPYLLLSSSSPSQVYEHPITTSTINSRILTPRVANIGCSPVEWAQVVEILRLLVSVSGQAGHGVEIWIEHNFEDHDAQFATLFQQSFDFFRWHLNDRPLACQSIRQRFAAVRWEADWSWSIPNLGDVEIACQYREEDVLPRGRFCGRDDVYKYEGNTIYLVRHVSLHLHPPLLPAIRGRRLPFPQKNDWRNNQANTQA